MCSACAQRLQSCKLRQEILHSRRSLSFGLLLYLLKPIPQRRTLAPDEDPEVDFFLVGGQPHGLYTIFRVMILGYHLEVFDDPGHVHIGGVEGRAACEDLDEGESPMLDALNDQILQVLLFDREASRYETGSIDDGQGRRVDRIAEKTEWGGFGGWEKHGGRRKLPLGHPVNGVVEEKKGHIRIVARDMG